MSLIDEIYEHIEDRVEIVRYNKSDSEIVKFFAGQTVFITGVTGYLGKIIVEKLLRDCDIERIYMLMRGNEKYSLDDRVHRYFQHVVFSRLAEENPNFQSKVTVIKGDLLAENLGISDEDKSTIINNVTVMYHNAANVKFDVKPSVSLRSNVLGTKKMLDLARECKKLKIFVYVSTAYSHLYQKNIHEEYYSSPVDDLQAVYDTIEADEKTEKGMSEKEVKTLIGKFPNIYPFSKAIAEDLVRQCARDAEFAVVLYRPSIVLSSYKEPLPGWCGNTNGPVLIFLACGLGLFRGGYHFGYPMDFIPSDYAVNTLLAITRHAYDQWSVNRRKKLIYNFGSSTVNPVTLLMLQAFDNEIPLTERSSKAVALSSTITPYKEWWKFVLCHWTLHFIPAVLADFGLLVSGRKPVALSIFWKATRHMDKIDYFGNGNWRIHMPNTLEVVDKMNAADREIFYCDIRELSWQELCWIGWRGLKLYILKEEITSEAARRRYYLLCYIHYGFRVIWFLIFCYVLFKLSYVFF